MTSGPAFLFHIGPHKTGTTYLQQRFRAARPELAARGILYPVVWTGDHGANHALLCERLRSGDAAALAADFASVLSTGADTILVSSESLAALPVDHLVTLRGLLGGRPARFVFYVRPWSELLPSSWQELVKQGLAATLPEFLVARLRSPAEFAPLNFGLRLKNFVQVFGASCLHIVSHSELRDRGTDLFTHFADTFLNWPDAPGETGLVNASLDTATIEIIRLMNSLSCRHGTAPRDRLRNAFDRLSDRSFLQPVVAAIEAHTHTVRIGDRWPGLAALHDTLAAEYKLRIVPPRRPNALFKSGVNDVPVADMTYLLEPGVPDILRGLHARLEADAQISPPHAIL